MTGRGNGLSAASYKPLVDLHPRLADAMLDALAESGVAAYAAPAVRPFVADLYAPVVRAPMDRLWVDSSAEVKARLVLDAQLPALRAEFETPRPPGELAPGQPRLRAADKDRRPPAGPGGPAGPRGAAGSGPSSPDSGDRDGADDPGPGEPPGWRESGPAQPPRASGPPGEAIPGGGSAGPPPADAGSGADQDRPTSPASPADDHGDGLDEAAIWASIVAGFDLTPDDPLPRWPVAEDLPPDRPGPSGLGPLLRRPRPDGAGERPGPAADLPRRHGGAGPPTGRAGADGPDDGHPAAADPTAGFGPVGGVGGADDQRGVDDRGGVDESAHEEHFVPPPPPPLPQLDTAAKLAWVGLIGGPLYFVVSMLLGWGVGGWTAIVAGLAFAAGFVALVARIRERADDDDGDDGAVV